jgi:hypothetical protein
VIFIARNIWAQSIDISNFLSFQCLLLVIFVIFIVVASSMISATCWNFVLSFFSKRKIDFKQAYNVYAKANIGKYLPGNVGHYAGRQLFGASLGLRQAHLVIASALELIYVLGSTFLLSVIFAWGTILRFTYEIFTKWNVRVFVITALLVVCAGIVIILFVIRHGKYSREFVACVKNRDFWGLLLKCFLFSLICPPLGNLPLALFIKISVPLTVSDALLIIAANIASWLIGFITPGAPGGVGVRESVLLLMLSPAIPQELVLTAAVMQRLGMILGDVSAWLLSEIWVKRNKNNLIISENDPKSKECLK